MIDKIQAVIFDIDGTLVDSMSLWHEIDIAYFERIGIPMPPDVQKAVEGMSFRETALYFQKHFQPEREVTDIENDWIEMAHEKYLSEIKAKPGAKEYLDFLQEKGIKLGVATSNDKKLAYAALSPHGFSEKLDSLRTSGEVNKGKPAPDVYLKVAEDLKIAPENCLVFEDTPSGMQAGKAAGMSVIGVRDDVSGRQIDEIMAVCDEYIENFYEMLEGRVEVKYEFSSGK